MKNVFITGVSRGIGKALAQKFLEEGFAVYGTSITGTLEYSDPHLFVFTLDLSSPDSIAVCVDAFRERAVSLDIVINNAGVCLDEDDTVVIPEKLRKTLEINLVGVIDFTEHILPFVVRGGHIVNISSTAGSIGLTSDIERSHHPGFYPSYKISKAALNMYTASLALRLKEKVIVSSVHPGWVRTAMGGEEAPVLPEEAAKNIFAFAISSPENGQFWFNGERLAW